MFAACVFHHRHGCIKAADIKSCIKIRLSLWQEGCFNVLIQDITATSLVDVRLCQMYPDEDTITHRYNSRVLDSDLHAAIQQLSSRTSDRILGPNNSCTKTGWKVLDILADKHPPLYILDLSNPDHITFKDYGPCQTSSKLTALQEMPKRLPASSKVMLAAVE